MRAVRIDGLGHVMVGLVGRRNPRGDKVQAQHRRPAALDLAVQRILLLAEILERQLLELLAGIPGGAHETALFRIGVVAQPARSLGRRHALQLLIGVALPSRWPCRCRCCWLKPIDIAAALEGVGLGDLQAGGILPGQRDLQLVLAGRHGIAGFRALEQRLVIGLIRGRGVAAADQAILGHEVSASDRCPAGRSAAGSGSSWVGACSGRRADPHAPGCRRACRSCRCSTSVSTVISCDGACASVRCIGRDGRRRSRRAAELDAAAMAEGMLPSADRALAWLAPVLAAVTGGWGA